LKSININIKQDEKPVEIKLSLTCSLCGHNLDFEVENISEDNVIDIFASCPNCDDICDKMIK